MKYIILILSLATISTRWIEVSRPQPHSLGSVVDSRVYWAGLRRTTDGGATWHRLDTGLEPLPFSFLKTCFLTYERGWITYARQGTYQTEDGGEHWQRILKESATAVIFADAENGWLQAVSTDSAVYYRTQDSGRSWIKCGSGARLQSVSYPDGRHVYGVAESGEVLRSTNGGCTFARWRALSGHIVNFSGTDRGVVVGRYGIVYIEGARESWIDPPVDAGIIYSAYFLDSKRGWILALPEYEGDVGLYEWSDGVWRKTVQPAERFLKYGWREGALHMLITRDSQASLPP